MLKVTLSRLALTTGLLALTGCGVIATAANNSVASSSPTSEWAPTQWSAETADQEYVSAGIQLGPPTSGISPSYSYLQAYAACTSGVAPCPPATPTLLLATFSDDQYGTIQSDGSVRPSFQGVLAWVMIWHDQSCLATGVPVVPGQPSPSPGYPADSCDQVVFINAQTNQYLVAYTGPPITTPTPSAGPTSG